jgi:hypothetical protein
MSNETTPSPATEQAIPEMTIEEALAELAKHTDGHISVAREACRYNNGVPVIRCQIWVYEMSKIYTDKTPDKALAAALAALAGPRPDPHLKKLEDAADGVPNEKLIEFTEKKTGRRLVPVTAE